MSKRVKRKQPTVEPDATARLLREVVEFASKNPEYWRTPTVDMTPRGRFYAYCYYRSDNNDEHAIGSGYHNTLAASVADLAQRIKDFLEGGE